MSKALPNKGRPGGFGGGLVIVDFFETAQKPMIWFPLKDELLPQGEASQLYIFSWVLVHAVPLGVLVQYLASPW